MERQHSRSEQMRVRRDFARTGKLSCQSGVECVTAWRGVDRKSASDADGISKLKRLETYFFR
jgi:hypothetical protein